MDYTKLLDTEDILRGIISNLEYFSPSERKVADYVLNYPENTIHLSIADLSKETHVSQPTIIRFCRKQGLRGYQDLKIKLAQSKSEPLKLIHEELSPSDTIEDISNKVIASHIIALDQTLKKLDYSAIEVIVNVIERSNTIDFYGLGGSGTVAIDAENKFLRTKLNTRACIDAHIQLMRTALMNEKDFIIIFSNTGDTNHFINILNLAKSRNVPSLVVTSYINSATAKLATYVIEIKANEIHYKKEPASSRIAMLSVIDIIVTAIALNMHNQYIENVYETRKAINSEKS